MENLDIAVVAIIAVSALFAFFRGFTREVLSIVAWLGAVAVAFYSGPFVRDKMDAILPEKWHWVDSFYLYYIPPFIVAVIFFSLLVGIIATQVRKTALGPLDRALGLLFGVARGALIVCLAYMVGIHMVKQEDTPDWVVKARSRPLMAMGAEQLQQMLPKSISEKGFQDALPGAKSAADKAKDTLQTTQAVGAIGDALDKLTAQPQPKSAQKPADPNNPEANSDSKGLDQLIQAQGEK
jgi:membrane protein required for colicin V production